MSKPTLSLAMITKNAGDHLKECLDSISPFVDEIVIVDNGSTDKTVKIAKKFGAKVYEVNPKDNPEYFCEYGGEFWPNFTRLRRLSFEKATKDWILWLDADDTVINPDLLEEKILEAEMKGYNVLPMKYLYEVIDGKVMSEHNKERVVKRGMFNWEFDDEWAVHENLYPINPEGNKGELVTEIEILHHKKENEFSTSNWRNYNILMWMLEKDKFKKDPRVYFLLGRELISLKKLDTAVKCLNKYLSMEYAAHDALDSCILLSEIQEAVGDFKAALDYALKGISIRPDHPIGYIYAARFLNYQGKYVEALDFIEQAKKKSTSSLDMITQKPYKMTILALDATVKALMSIKEYQSAVEVINANFDELLDEDKKEYEDKLKECKDEIATNKMLGVVSALVDNKIGQLKSENIEPTIKDFDPIFSLFDKGVKISPLYTQLRKFCKDYRVHESNEITIVHMNNFECWDAESIMKNGGGGSETACAELATRFQKHGFKVTVYANPEKERKIKGVEWKRFENINLADKFNIFISLRGQAIFKDYVIDAKKKYLWLQDIMNPIDYTPDLYEQLDKIIILSKYHREGALNVPESKFYYTTNGINLKLIKEVEKENIKRIKNKCVYISSADRGLINMIEFWPDVKKSVKDATCYDFYGWKSWNVFATNEEAEKLKQKLIAGMKKVGIVEGGRISKKDLYRQLFSADYHTYPLIGPAETSCIAVMESQACGAIPITTGITALEETQQYGIKIPLSKYKQALIETMQHIPCDDVKYRKKMMKWARRHFNWERVAKQWIKDLF